MLLLIDVTVISIRHCIESRVRAVAAHCSASLLFLQGFSQKSSYDSLLLQDGLVLLSDQISQHFLLFSQTRLKLQQSLNIIKNLCEQCWAGSPSDHTRHSGSVMSYVNTWEIIHNRKCQEKRNLRSLPWSHSTSISVKRPTRPTTDYAAWCLLNKPIHHQGCLHWMRKANLWLGYWGGEGCTLPLCWTFPNVLSVASLTSYAYHLKIPQPSTGPMSYLSYSGSAVFPD